MSGLIYLVPTLVTIVISMMIVRAGAIALTMTGMNYEKAKFQALSAFSGTGFTTREAERVVNNAQRRKIVTWLMILGNAGIVTVIVTATSSFTHAEGLGALSNLLFLLIGIALIWLLIRQSGLVQRWERFVHGKLSRRRDPDEDLPPDELLHFAEGYGVLRFRVPEESRIIAFGFAELSEQLENASVLGLERGDDWISRHHHGETTVEAEDLLVVYGNMPQLKHEVKIAISPRNHES